MFLTLILLKLISFGSGADNFNCRGEDVRFERVIGLRPGNNFHPLHLHSSSTRNAKPVTLECLRKCAENEQCASFVLYYKNYSCVWFQNEAENDLAEQESVLDNNVAWFKKMCYRGACNHTLWTFDRIPGATLVGNNTKSLEKPITRAECQQHCLNEKSFECRSTKFYARSSNEHYEEVGKCILSNADRHLLPNAFRASGYNDEYFENQCATNIFNEYCAFEEYENLILSHTDISYQNLTKDECQTHCENNEHFKCRGFSLVPTSRTANSNLASKTFTCLIHSENSKVHGPKSLKEYPEGKYYERAPCLNISVTCTNDLMTVNFQPDHAFNGRLYMKGYSENRECYAIGKNRDKVVLSIPILERKCGLIEVRGSLNRTLIASTMILQYNSLVQTQADRIIKVGCIFSNSSKVVVGAGFNFTEDHVSSGSNLVNSTSQLPSVEMKIIDLTTSDEVSDTQIGDELQLIIEMRPANGGIDIWAGHLVAMTENGQDSILLLDDRGCPTNLDVFPGLTKTITDDNSIRLSSTFQAFKFSTSNIIRFSVIVQFCSKECPPVLCGGVTYNKRKREIHTSDGNDVRKINRTEFQQIGNANNITIKQLPLELVLLVRNVNLQPDSLVYGENNKILVAGYDYATNEICINSSLIIGLIVTWLLIQIILVVSCIILVRRYKKFYEEQYLNESLEELHKNFGLGFSNLDTSRRVHFADDGHLT